MRGELPKSIGERYWIVRQIGRGGMGSVYEAVDGQTQRRVAVKVIMTEMARDPTLLVRFQREVRAASALDTPHIVQVIDAGQDAATGLPFMVMEYLEGEDLQSVLKRLGALPTDLALRIGAQAAQALHKAHEHHIVHRDIKPANFFLAKQEGGGRIVKLLDFGVAKIRRDPTRNVDDTSGLTKTGSMLGSPLYMSPEQARGHKDIDFRSDLWSLGVVLYQALAGRTPHYDTDELGELIILICTEPPEAIQDVAPWVRPEAASIVHRALRFNPEERFRSAADMLAWIAALVPGGIAISEDLLRPLTEAERSVVAPRITESLHDAPPPRRGSTSQSRGNAGGPLSTISSGAVDASTGAVTPAGAAPRELQVSGPPPAHPSRTPAMIAGLIAATLVGGGVAYQVTRPPPPPAPAAGPVEAKPRSVKMVVIPADATVEVDGVAAPVTNGVVEIKGPLGSLHTVRIAAGGAETTGDVAITENGASPPKMELAPAAEKDPPAPAGSATATASPPFPPGRPAPPPRTSGSAPPGAPTPALRFNR